MNCDASVWIEQEHIPWNLLWFKQSSFEKLWFLHWKAAL